MVRWQALKTNSWMVRELDGWMAGLRTWPWRDLWWATFSFAQVRVGFSQFL
jgi:hypothetical protein